jgi:hypothetical protein
MPINNVKFCKGSVNRYYFPLNNYEKTTSLLQVIAASYMFKRLSNRACSVDFKSNFSDLIFGIQRICRLWEQSHSTFYYTG